MKKKMYKSKKHWVIASATVLAIFGTAGGTVLAEELPTSVDTTVSGCISSASTSVDTTPSVSSVLVSVDTTVSTSSVSAPVDTTPSVSSVPASVDTTLATSNVPSSVDINASSAPTPANNTVNSNNGSENVTSEASISTLDVGDTTNKAKVITSNTISGGAPVLLSGAMGGSTTSQQTTSSLVEASISGNNLTIRYNGTLTSNESIKFAVWSEVNNQDDLVWYNADTSGMAYVDLSKHKNYGLYNIHTYSFKVGQSSTVINAMTVTVAQPEVQTNITKTSTGNFDIVINDVPDTISSITVPVWSDKDGQDDIQWYNASKIGIGTYKISVSVKNHHSDNGHYSAHIYGQSTITGGVIGLAVSSGFDNVDTRSNATVSMINYAEDKTNFDVVVAGNLATKDIKGVAIAVWSETGGQDDIKWYTPDVSNDRATARIDIADCSDTSDYYNVHVYVDYGDGSRSGTVLGSYKISKPAEKNIVTANLTEKGISLNLDSNTVKDYSKVKFAVWSSENGQDDIKWYDANAMGTAMAAYENHSGYGTYNIHTYLFDNNKVIGLNATTIVIAKPNVKTSIVQTNSTTYTVTVSDVPLYISSIILPVWSNNNDQDDIKWTATTKIDSTTYMATVNLKDHNFETGQYSVHVYGQSKLGNQFVALAATAGFIVTNIDVQIVDPTITVTNYNQNSGSLLLKISESSVSKSLKTIHVAAWSESDQSNIHWYNVDVSGDQTIIPININNHYYIAGNYTIHTYIDFTDNTRKGYNVGTYYLSSTVSQQISRVLELAGNLVGVVGGSSQHSQIVADYNSINPKPVGYTVVSDDDWCDVFVTTVFQRVGLSSLIGRECGVERHIQILKQLGIWDEDGTITPKAGDIITFNWDTYGQENDGFADHIGIVEKVENNIIYTIEGNSNNQVRHKGYEIGQGNIRGYGIPKYMV